MGWAKYYEDNMSIYIGRMTVRDTEATPVFYERPEIIKDPVVKVVAAGNRKKDVVTEKDGWNYNRSGRKGLKLVFQNGADEGVIRKMQMNGWWWSKANACWYNQDTNGNRKYAMALYELGARVSVSM